MIIWVLFVIGYGYYSDVCVGENIGKERIVVIGSGNWGSVVVKFVVINVFFYENIYGMWVLSI